MDIYEQKYKEALERAKTLQKTCDSQAVVGWCEYLFPELKESEDEKIRKDLIAIFKGEIPYTSEEDAKRYIAWLEKQEGCEYIKKDWLEHIKQSWYKEGFIDGKYSGGTSKEWTINDATTLNELIDFLENGTAKLQHDLTRYANWLKIQFTPIEKQGEQKHSIDINKMVDDYANNKEHGNEEFGKPVHCMIRAYRQGLNDAIGKVVLAPVWSEEDEEMLSEIITDIKSAQSKYPDSQMNQIIIEEEVNWLKTIKQRIGG